MTSRAIFAAIVVLAPAALLPAQDSATIKVETRAVQINVAVKDAEGRSVRGLRQENFIVTDNGHRREIRMFSSEDEPAPAAAPVRLPPNVFSNRFRNADAGRRITAILIDAVSTPFEHQAYARAQAIRAVEKMAGGESIALYVLDDNLWVLQNYTTEPERLLIALNSYVPRQPPMPDRTGEFNPRGRRGPPVRMEAPRGMTGMFVRNRIESTLEALRLISRQMAGVSGRKSLLWLTAGFPPYTDYRHEIETTIDAVNDSNVALYPVDTRGLLVGRGANTTIRTMQELADSTGGQAYYNRNDVGQAIQEAIDDSRHTYSLAFYLPEKDLDGQFHHLTVKVDRPGLDLHYRRGYQATLDSQPAGKSKDKGIQSLESELVGPLDRSALGIDARVEIVQTEKGRSLRISIVLDPSTVAQRQPDGSSAMKLSELFLLTGAGSRVLARTASRVTVEVQPGNPVGMFAQTIPLRAGAQTLQIVIRDVVSGHTGTLTVPLKNLTN